jgi:hypothetical protein
MYSIIDSVKKLLVYQGLSLFKLIKANFLFYNWCGDDWSSNWLVCWEIINIERNPGTNPNHILLNVPLFLVVFRANDWQSNQPCNILISGRSHVSLNMIQNSSSRSKLQYWGWREGPWIVLYVYYFSIGAWRTVLTWTFVSIDHRYLSKVVSGPKL